jgi:3-oxoacyl-[acyl-carrier protein] reductase
MQTPRVALITGASRGIGAAIARALSASGHTVAIHCRSQRKLAAKVLNECNGRGAVFSADVRDPKAVHALVSEVQNQLGTIDVVVHNANIDFPIGFFWEQSWQDVSAKLLHEVGAFHALVAATIPSMIQRKWGRMIAISSMMSRKGSPGFATHACAKSAVDAAAYVLAREVGMHGITVNVIAPGATHTSSTAHLSPQVRAWIEQKTPTARMGTPEDIAAVVAMVASDQGQWIHGQYLQLDGGLDGPLPFTWKEIIQM